MRNFIGSVGNRVFIIVAGGALIGGITTHMLSAYAHYNSQLKSRENKIAERVDMIVSPIVDASPSAYEDEQKLSKYWGIESTQVDDTGNASNDYPSLATAIKNKLGDNRTVIVSKQIGCLPVKKPHSLDSLFRDDKCQAVFVRLQNGKYQKIKFRTDAHNLNWQLIYYRSPYFGLFLFLLAGLAYIVARITVRPIQNLARAAGELGHDIDHAPLAETGPIEVRQAAMAFNAMQARIKRQIQHRTHMLAAITHDLQTPLTRLRLRLEKISDVELHRKFAQDLAMMQTMVREGLDLARSMDSTEAMQKLDIDSLLDSICADATDARQDVTLAGRTGASIKAQPNTLRRCINNVLDNAVKYGHHARVHAMREGNDIVIKIRDGGQGIPADQLETVFDAFSRLETSRSRETGGTGLGLTIARNIAENHDGTLQLMNHPDGGLEAILRLPALR
nr:ATP-binding protein [Collimonas arenae]